MVEKLYNNNKKKNIRMFVYKKNMQAVHNESMVKKIRYFLP